MTTPITINDQNNYHSPREDTTLTAYGEGWYVRGKPTQRLGRTSQIGALTGVGPNMNAPAWGSSGPYPILQ